jgi:hypothetical protein
MRRWAGVLCGALLLALCAPAGPQVLLLSRDGTVFGLPVRDSSTELVGWTEDGTGLLVRRERHTLRLDLATGATTPRPMLDDAVSVGPGARTVVMRYRRGGVGTSPANTRCSVAAATRPSGGSSCAPRGRCTVAPAARRRWAG